MTPRARTLLIAACAALAASAAVAQTFRTGITAVVLDVVVTDGRGEPIRDLTKEDFEVIEDGQTRTVLSTTLVSVPIDRDRGHVQPRDVWTNLLPPQRRIFTIVIDDLDTDPRDAPRVRDVVHRFITSLPDGDLAAVVYCGQQAGAQEFTADKTRLLASVERLTGRRPQGIDAAGFGDVEVTAPAERNANFLRVFATIQNVVEWLAGVEGRRKAVVLVTGAVPSAFTDLSRDSRIADELQRIATGAMRANVAIYPIDARGLAAPDDTATETTVLAALAHETGGVLTVNTNNLTRGFDTVIRDSSDYYLVAFTPREESNQKTARLHRIVVHARRSGAVVRSRQAYVTGAAAATNTTTNKTAIASLLASPLPGGRLPLEVQAASFADVKGRGHVFAITEIAGEAVKFDARDAQQMAVLDYRVAATDASGRILASDSRRLDFRLSDLRRDQVSGGSVRLISALDLKPGQYRVRAAVVDERRQEHGVLAGDLDVPDVAKAPIAMSGILLASAAVRSPVFRGDVKAFEGRLPMPPTTARTFGRGDAVEVYAEVYAREGGPLPDLTAAIYDAEGRRIGEERLTLGAKHPGLAGRRCFTIRLPLKVAALPAGRFALELSARAGDSRASTRLVFDVR